MTAYTPPGWPAGVHPPDSEEFESTAVGWLLDVVPPDYRLHGVLRRYPVALAAVARHHSRACVEGARQGYRTARAELAGVLPAHAVDTVLAAYRKEGARLAATARAVGLVERALRGEVFTPRMAQEKGIRSTPAGIETAAGSEAGSPGTAGAGAGGPAAEGEKAVPPPAGPEHEEAKATPPRAAGPRARSPRTASVKRAGPPEPAPAASAGQPEPASARPRRAAPRQAAPQRAGARQATR